MDQPSLLNAAPRRRSAFGQTGAIARAALRLLEGWKGFPALQASMEAMSGTDAFLAGGAVRDVAWGCRPIKDLDIFIEWKGFAPFLHELSKYGHLGLGPFGSPRWYPASGGVYADVICIERFDNGVQNCKTIVDALCQFDFTANAVAVNLRTGDLHDPLGGIDDMLNGTMRAVRFDYPDEPISNSVDLSRLEVLWFRLTHYTHLLGLKPETTTAAWLRDNDKFGKRVSLFSESFFPPQLRQLD